MLTGVLGTATSISCNPSPDSIDTPTLCSATVTGGGAVPPTGTIAWSTDSGVAAQFSSTTCTLGGGASCSVIYTPSSFGSSSANALTASYGGDGGYLPSSGQLTLVIKKRSTSVGVECVPNPVAQGATTSCTASVLDTDAGTPVAVTGTASWSVSGTSLGTLLSSTCLLGSSGSCSVSYQAPATGGSNTFTASYGGDTYHTSSTSSGYTLSVLRPSNTTVTCTSSTDTAGAPITCTAAVSDSGNSHTTPSGSVSWSVAPNAGAFTAASGSTFNAGPPPSCVLVSGNGNGSSSTCSVTYTPGSTGTQTITATYTGDAAHVGSSGRTSITVTSAPANSLSLVASSGTTTAGTPVGVTVTVKDQFGNVATGYTGTIHFSSSDGKALLPINYAFTTSDAGVHTFGGAVTLETAGSQTVTATDTVTASIAGASNPIRVDAAALSRLGVAASPTVLTAGAPASVSVTAQDQYGNPATGYVGTITFNSTDTKATLPPNYTFVAADNGTHIFTATLKTAGSRTISATDTTTSTLTGTSNSITVNAAPATLLSIVASTGTSIAGSPFNLTVTLMDQFGNTATGYAGTIHVSSTDAKAVLPSNYTFTSTDAGVHIFTGSANLETAGSQTVTATDTMTSALTGSTNAISVSAATASKLSLIGPSLDAAGAPVSITVMAQDQYGNSVTGYAGTIHFTSTDVLAGLPANYAFVSADNGMHAFNVTLKSAGNQTITATDTKSGSITGTSNPVVVAAAAATTLSTVASTGSATAGTPVGVTVTARDQFGNVAIAYSGTIHFTSTDGRAILPANYTFTTADAGVHSFASAVTLETVGNQTVAASDTLSPSITGNTNPISVNPAAAATLSAVATTGSTTAGAPFSITVTVRDPFGNTATGYTGTIHFTTTDKQAILPANYTFTTADAGVRVFSSGVTLETAGKQTIAATDTVNSTINGGTDPITVSAAAAARLSLVGTPGTVTAGSTTAVTVTAQDQYGNLATAYAGVVRFTSTDLLAGSPANYTFVGADNGSHTFNVTLKTAGSQTVTASDTVNSTVTGTSNRITVNAATVSQFMLTVSPTGSTAGTSLSTSVVAEDQYGNVNPGFSGTVRFTSTDTQADLPKDYAFLAADAGMHTFSGLVLKTAGSQTITVTDATNAALSATSSALTVAPGTASKLVVAQQPTSAAATAVIDPAITVQVQDSFGNIATSSSALVGVTLLSNPNGGNLGGTQSISAVSGVATFNTLSIDKAGSGYTLILSSSGLASAISETFTISVGLPTRSPADKGVLEIGRSGSWDG
jgi:hypothetical protein